MTLPRWIPGWLPVAVLAIGAFWLFSRWDGAQTERLHELDVQQDSAVAQTLKVAKAHRAQVKASVDADREIARLRVGQARERGILEAARHRADSLESTVAAILAGLPDSAAHPVTSLLATKDSQIASLGRLLASDSSIVDTLTKDRDRWHTTAENNATDRDHWKRRAVANLAEAKRGCLPIIGCVNRTAAFAIGAVLGAVGSRAIH